MEDICLRHYIFLVSHTVEDLVFIWNMTDPLVVNAEIELPQLDISNNYTTDCTIEYSTGMRAYCSDSIVNLRLYPSSQVISPVWP